MTCGFTKGGKCGCFVLIKNDFFDVNPPYGQSDYTINLGPAIQFIHLVTLPVQQVRQVHTSYVPSTWPSCFLSSLQVAALGSTNESKNR